MDGSTGNIVGSVTSCYATSDDYEYEGRSYLFKEVEREMPDTWHSNRISQIIDPFLNNLAQLPSASVIHVNKNNNQNHCHSTYEVKHVPVQPQTTKRRTTANKKERRRTQSINNAFFCLRSKIPNVPYDTKLSKIKTLKLAILYIKYLTEVIKGDKDLSSGFRSELMPLAKLTGPKLKKNIKSELKKAFMSLQNLLQDEQHFMKCKGRTGWPQDVWQSVLKVSRN